MKTFAISDTHGLHRRVIVPEADCIIHAGDSTNYYQLIPNQQEFEDFFDWFANLPIQHKIIIAGNHDAWATKAYNRDRLKEAGIIYLEHEYHQIGDIKFFGSPYTPTFGTWHFMKDRGKLDNYWKDLDSDIDVLITHGPPKGILDLSENRERVIEQCGDASLYKRVREKSPRFHIFGHIHDYMGCMNFGSLTRDFGTTFMNVSSVEDGKFGVLKHNGIVVTL